MFRIFAPIKYLEEKNIKINSKKFENLKRAVVTTVEKKRPGQILATI